MRMVGKDNISELKLKDLTSQRFCTAREEDEWRISLIMELVETRNNQLDIADLKKDEITSILDHACIS